MSFLKQVNQLGIWDLLQFIVMVVAFLAGLKIYRWWVKRSIKNLNLFIEHRRDNSNYPLKILFEIRNHTGRSVVISYAYFKYNRLRPDQKARGDTLTGDYEMKFPEHPCAPLLTEVECFLRHKEAVNTWMPLDPKHTDQEVIDALESRKAGTLSYFVTWIQEKPKTERLETPV